MLQFKTGSVFLYPTKSTSISLPNSSNYSTNSKSNTLKKSLCKGPAKRSSSFIIIKFRNTENGYSKANIVFQNLSIPLAWPVDEYFGTKRELREFTVQLLFRTADGREVFSRVIENVNRNITDIEFKEPFVFPFQFPDFAIEIIVYCKRTDKKANSSIVQTFSRSLGQSLRIPLKHYLKNANRYVDINEVKKASTINAEFLENYRNPEKMCALGCAKFYLRNVSLSGQIHTYNLEVFPIETYLRASRFQLLPIYGNICTLVTAQPASLQSPLAEGYLDIFLVKENVLLQKMFCVLQGAQLNCVNELSVKNASSTQISLIEEVESRNKHLNPKTLTIPIDQKSTIGSTAFSTALRLTIFDEKTHSFRQYIFISESKSAYLGWRRAFQLQISDCIAWSCFASAQKNSYAKKITLPQSAISNNLQLNGDESKYLGLNEQANIDLSTQRRQRPPIASNFFQNQFEKPSSDLQNNYKNDNLKTKTLQYIKKSAIFSDLSPSLNNNNNMQFQINNFNKMENNISTKPKSNEQVFSKLKEQNMNNYLINALPHTNDKSKDLALIASKSLPPKLIFNSDVKIVSSKNMSVLSKTQVNALNEKWNKNEHNQSFSNVVQTIPKKRSVSMERPLTETKFLAKIKSVLLEPLSSNNKAAPLRESPKIKPVLPFQKLCYVNTNSEKKSLLSEQILSKINNNFLLTDNQKSPVKTTLHNNFQNLDNLPKLPKTKNDVSQLKEKFQEDKKLKNNGQNVGQKKGFIISLQVGLEENEDNLKKNELPFYSSDYNCVDRKIDFTKKPNNPYKPSNLKTSNDCKLVNRKISASSISTTCTSSSQEVQRLDEIFLDLNKTSLPEAFETSRNIPILLPLKHEKLLQMDYNWNSKNEKQQTNSNCRLNDLFSDTKNCTGFRQLRDKLNKPPPQTLVNTNNINVVPKTTFATKYKSFARENYIQRCLPDVTG